MEGERRLNRADEKWEAESVYGAPLSASREEARGKGMTVEPFDPRAFLITRLMPDRQ